jgi:hypothetical protein
MPEILRVYLDTSIYGGVEDEEFRLHSELVFCSASVGNGIFGRRG